ncbi:MAG: hypothetical protein ACRDRW_19065 [Pseudonocardiaceae bacterium]
MDTAQTPNKPRKWVKTRYFDPFHPSLQDSRCPACGNYLRHADPQPQSSPHDWEQWLRATRKAITKQRIGYTEQHSTPDSNGNWPYLIHTHRHQRPPPTTTPSTPHSSPACSRSMVTTSPAGLRRCRVRWARAGR